MSAATVAFGANTVLDGIDLAVDRHEFVALIGPSGCGKTTLLNAIAGLQPLDAGEVICHGAPVHGPGADRAMVFQDDAVFPWMRVRENVGYGLRLNGTDRRARATKVTEALSLVGLQESAERWPRELSGGMRKRVDLARALAVDPPVLLMDEPYGALDMMTKERLQVDVERIFETGDMTVVFVTHDLEEAIFLSDRVVVLAPGPGRVSDELDVALPRPRPPAIKLTPAFQALRAELGAMLERAVPLAATAGAPA